MSGKRKAVLIILFNSVVAILLVGLVLLARWRAPSRPTLYWDIAILVGCVSINGIILYANGKRVRREQSAAAR
jgi:hypothetical protein